MKNLILAIILVSSSFGATGKDGEGIFKKRCMSCHTVGKGRMVGPDLKDVHTKYDQDKLYKWIRSSQTIIKGGDPEAIALYEEYFEVMMPDFDFLSDDELGSIIDYIEKQSIDPPPEIASIGAESNNSNAAKVPEVVNTLNSANKRKFVVDPHTSPVYFGAVLTIIFFGVVLWVLLNAIKAIAAEVTMLRNSNE
ncbi:MAG: hypothetical protein COB85_06365 [Bacteroidetes bacterium]|nr:MAG: hypothetical protein COB85_06365 [Bacteroidota bacterium]